MRFNCSICSGGIEVPDEFAEAQVICPNCGREVIVPRCDGGFDATGADTADDGMGIGAEPARVTTPEEFRARQEARRLRGRLVWGLALSAVILGLVAVVLFVLPSSSLIEVASEAAAKKSRRELYARAGIAPLGFYEAAVLPGLRGEAEGGAGWSLDGEGKTWLVLEAVVSPRFFPPTDEGYARIVQEAERHKASHPERTAPPRERCRFFDPLKFQLIAKGVDAARGELISINYGEYRGFYSAFSYVAPEGSPADGARENSKELEDGMHLSIAFVVPAGGIDRNEVWIQLDGLEAKKVPPVDSRAIEW